MPRTSRSAWLRTPWMRTITRLALVLAGTVVIGTLVGAPWLLLGIAALGIVAWDHWRLHRVLARLTERRRHHALPEGQGAWAELDRLLLRNESESRMRKRRLIDMLRVYRAAAAALPDAIVVVERNSQRIQWFNQAATQLLSLERGALGTPMAERLRPLQLSHWLAAGRNAEPLEIASPWHPGTTLSLRLIPWSEHLWLLLARDVTRLLHLEQMRRDFVANVSHELRTPLTVIHGYLDVLDPDEHPDWAPMLTEMQRQSQRMAQLVEDLLTLSRLEAADHLPAEETVAMAAMLNALKREALALSQGRHTVQVEDSAGVDLLGSAKELHSAFSNLVSNAIRYTPAGGTVVVRFRREAAQKPGVPGAVLEVTDTGQGIAESHLPRITERFYRVSNSRSRETGGTGLGLSIVKHVLNLHQARLGVASEVGRGSTFSCHFGPERVRAREPLDLVSP